MAEENENVRVKDFVETVDITELTGDDYLLVDRTNDTVKILGDAIAPKSVQDNSVQSIAPAFDPTRTESNAYEYGEFVEKNGKLYECIVESHYGDWNSDHFANYPISAFLANLSDFLVNGITVVASKDDSVYDWQEGLCDGTDGRITADNRFKYNVVLIPAYQNTTYIIGSRETHERIYFYDKLGDFISASDETGAHASKFVFTTPANCYFMRYSYKINSSDGSVLKWNDATFAKKRLEELKGKLDVYDSMLIPNKTLIANKDDTTYDWQDGLCQSENGSITADNRFKYNVNLIPVHSGTRYHFGGRQPAERVYFYDKNGVFVKSSDAAGSGVNVSGVDITIPENCYFVRYSYYPRSYDTSELRWIDGFSCERLEKRIDGIRYFTDEETLVKGISVVASEDKVSLDWRDGACLSTDGTITSYPGFKYNYVLVPVSPSTRYILGSRESSERVYFYDKFGNFIDSSDRPGSRVTTFEFTTPANCYFVRYSYYTQRTNASVLRWNDISSLIRVEQEVRKDIGNASYGVVHCPKVYDRVVGSGQRNETRVYAEGFIYGEVKPLKINDGTFVSITETSATAGESSKTAVLSGDGYGAKQVNIPVNRIAVTSGMTSNKKFILFVGESTTDMKEKDPLHGDYFEDWGIPSSVQKYNIKDRVDGIGFDLKTIGTRNNLELAFTYKGNGYTNRSFNEGRSGWPSYAYSNWPCIAKLSTSSTRFGAVQMWYALGLATKTPYDQSAYNVESEAYTGAAEQRELITKTKFGKYKVDGASSLWNLVKYLGTQTSAGYPSFSDSDDYTGSAAQIAELQSWCDSLANDPINPFYDLTFARDSTKDTAFNLDAYLARYRTMDDLGVRLVGSAGDTVTGSDGETYTIGTKVVSTSDYDVCTPDLIVFNVVINDTENTPSYSVIVDAVKALVDSVDVECAWYGTRYPGALIPSLWRDSNVSAVVNPEVYGKALDALNSWFETQTGKTAIPAVFVQPPNSVTGGYVSHSFDSGDIVDASQRNIHPGIEAYRAIGWEIINWIYSLS